MYPKKVIVYNTRNKTWKCQHVLVWFEIIIIKKKENTKFGKTCTLKNHMYFKKSYLLKIDL
jgi:hypothetical protein